MFNHLIVVMIDDLFDSFKEKYSKAKINKEIIDITDCFKKNNEEYEAPKSYGDLKKNKVILYTVRGAELIKKYEKDQEGKLIIKNNKPKINKNSKDFKVMSCLCQYDIRNTSLQEINDALKTTNNIQGYNKETLEKIIKKIKQEQPEFNPEKDTAFIFAGKQKKVYNRLELNKIWFSQIISKGRKAPDTMSYEEAKLMEKIFPKKILEGNKEEIKKRSYMYGREIHTEESEEFLEIKIKAYQKYKKTIKYKIKNKKEKIRTKIYTGIIDTIGNVSYSIIAGSVLDYLSGLNLKGIIASRASATIINTTTEEYTVHGGITYTKQ